MIKKVMITKKVSVPTDIKVEVFETSDGRQFGKEEVAIEYEKLKDMKVVGIESKVINDSLVTQYSGRFHIVHFTKEEEVEAYEQNLRGKEDRGIWGSWVSCRDKFKFPCWIACHYIYHEDDNSYSAIYMTLDEVKQDLNNVLQQIHDIENG